MEMTDQQLFEAIENAAFILGNRRGKVLTAEDYRRLASELNRLALVADTKYTDALPQKPTATPA